MMKHLVLFTTLLLLIVNTVFCHSSIDTVLKLLDLQDYDNETLYEVLTVCVTNAFGLPALWITFKHGMYEELVIGFMTILTSTCYHVGETLHRRIWGMSAGQWHRLDNVFIILALQNLFLYLFLSTRLHCLSKFETDPVVTEEDRKFVKREKQIARFLRWFGLAHCFVCQEKAPWVEFYTYLPILVILVIALIKWRWNPAKYRPRFNFVRVFTSIACTLIGVGFFVIGLDDKNDYLRIYHGLWHVFVSLSFMMFYLSKQQYSLKTKTE